jgi:large subunit ribosomal protein L6
MSRIGKTPIQIPKDVTVTQDNGRVIVKGPKGDLHLTIPNILRVSISDIVSIQRHRHDGVTKAIHGNFRARLANAITGVSKGWTKTLELSGVGFRAEVSNTNLVLTIGFSHPVTVKAPLGITYAAQEGKIMISGIDKHLVGQTAADIRNIKKPEPYKGKGIKYLGEHIRKKAGKAKAVGSTIGGSK